MLKGIPATIGPELLKVMHEMGHGDRLTLADAHFPGHSLGPRVLRADGLRIAPLLGDILKLFELDQPACPLAMMAVEQASEADPQVEQDYLAVVRTVSLAPASVLRLPRHEFYEAARSSFAIVMTGDTRPYGNLMLTKGITPTT